MAIVDTLNRSNFVDRIMQIRPDNFSREALGLIFDYLEELSDAMEEPIEFDPIGVCVKYAEMTKDEFLQAYPTYIESDDDVEEMIIDCIDSASVCIGRTSSGSFVFVQF